MLLQCTRAPTPVSTRHPNARHRQRQVIHRGDISDILARPRHFLQVRQSTTLSKHPMPLENCQSLPKSQLSAKMTHFLRFRLTAHVCLEYTATVLQHVNDSRR
jgi:hypothetical protein